MVEHAHPSEPKGSAKDSGKRSAPGGSERPVLSRYARRAAAEPDAREADETAAPAGEEPSTSVRAGAVVGDGVAISPPSPELRPLYEDPPALTEEPPATAREPRAPAQAQQATGPAPRATAEDPHAAAGQEPALRQEPGGRAPDPDSQALSDEPQALPDEPQALTGEPQALPDGPSAPAEHAARAQRATTNDTRDRRSRPHPPEDPAPGDPIFGRDFGRDRERDFGPDRERDFGPDLERDFGRDRDRETSDEAVRRVEASEVHDADREDDRFGRAVLPMPGGRGADRTSGKKVPFWKRLAMPLVQSATGGAHATTRSPGTRAPSLDPILTRLGALERQIAANQSATESQLTRFEENLTRLWELEEQMTITEVRERLALLEANQEEIADGLHTVSRNLVLVAVVLAAGLAAGLLALGLLL